MHWLSDLVFSDIPMRNGNLDSQKNLYRDLYSSFIHSCQNCYFHWSDRFFIVQIFCSYSNLNNHRLSVIHSSKTCVQRMYLLFCYTEFLNNRYSSPNLITLINLCCFIMDILKIDFKKKMTVAAGMPWPPTALDGATSLIQATSFTHCHICLLLYM